MKILENVDVVVIKKKFTSLSDDSTSPWWISPICLYSGSDRMTFRKSHFMIRILVHFGRHVHRFAHFWPYRELWNLSGEYGGVLKIRFWEFLQCASTVVPIGWRGIWRRDSNSRLLWTTRPSVRSFFTHTNLKWNFEWRDDVGLKISFCPLSMMNAPLWWWIQCPSVKFIRILVHWTTRPSIRSFFSWLLYSQRKKIEEDGRRFSFRFSEEEILGVQEPWTTHRFKFKFDDVLRVMPWNMFGTRKVRPSVHDVRGGHQSVDRWCWKDERGVSNVSL